MKRRLIRFLRYLLRCLGDRDTVVIRRDPTQLEQRLLNVDIDRENKRLVDEIRLLSNQLAAERRRTMVAVGETAAEAYEKCSLVATAHGQPELADIYMGMRWGRAGK